MPWREITFTYRVPDEMADCLALFAGCSHDGPAPPAYCAGEWVFMAKDVNMDCDCLNEECPCECGEFACSCPSECAECA